MIALLAACGGEPSATAPAVASFDATPGSVRAGVPTAVVWSWSYAVKPSPEPTCTIDNGVGVVTSGQETMVTLTQATTFTLTCANSAGSDSTQLAILAEPVAPSIAAFTATPDRVEPGTPTSITWNWTYATEPTLAAPTCSIDNGIGVVTRGQQMSVTLDQTTTFTLTCANSAGTDSKSLVLSAASMRPVIATFTATPTTIDAGVPTAVTWNWTYADATVPAPACSIDNGVGAVTRGQETQLTLTENTLFTLTCANAFGTETAQVTVTVNVVAPVLATFTATPSTLMPNTGNAITWDWTYANTPLPPPACTIDQGIGTMTPGGQSTLTLPQARTFRLRCTNSAGIATRDVTVGVDECAGGTHDCGANATCSDTLNGFTCACNGGYSGNGDVCSVNVSCGATPGACSPDATCVGGNTCVCNPGYVGDGVTCTRARITFVTSTSGTGNLSTWPGAVGTGLAAADSICQARAAAAGLSGSYVAWMSDANNDAYCRVHGLSGKKASSCGQSALPVSAGPWVRLDPARQPAAPRIDKLLAPTRQTFYPVIFSEMGTQVPSPSGIWTGTGDDGALSGTACLDWTSGSGTVTGAIGDVFGGGTAWTDQGADPACNSFARIRCVETLPGPALPSLHPGGARRMFVTSVAGSAQLSTWADAQGLSSVSAADAICQSRTRHAGFANASSFRAWLSYSAVSATSRFSSGGPWYRPDGILVAANRADLTDGFLAAPLNLTETNLYLPGSAESASVWTGTTSSGNSYSASYTCTNWTSAASVGIVGRHDLADFRWTAVGSAGLPAPVSCAATDYRLYCLEDSP